MQQRDDVGVHVVARVAVQRIEVERRPRGCRGDRASSWTRGYYERLERNHHTTSGGHVLRSTCAGALLVGRFAAARRPRAGRGGRWATVNVCDTAEHPNEVGVRPRCRAPSAASSRQIRFRLQWRDGDRWRCVESADSGWRRIGRALAVGLGLRAPPPEGEIVFRGVVRYRWRRDGETIRGASEITEAGHRSTAGADPEG